MRSNRRAKMIIGSVISFLGFHFILNLGSNPYYNTTEGLIAGSAWVGVGLLIVIGSGKIKETFSRREKIELS